MLTKHIEVMASSDLTTPFQLNTLQSIEWWIVKSFEGSDRSLFKEIYQNAPGRTEENHGNVSQDRRCPGQDSNRIPSECSFRALPLLK